MKKLAVGLIVFFLLFLTGCEMNSVFREVDVSRLNANIEQQKINYSVVDIDVSGMDGIDKIVVIAASEYEGVATQSVSEAFFPSRSATSYTFSMDFKNFGKFGVIVDFYSQGRVVKTQRHEVGITAQEYNLAALSASFPVLYFSTSIWDINEDAGRPIPTIVYLERSGAYDWNRLPENVHALPYATDAEINSTLTYHTLRPKMAAYIADLYELNPSANFNLYISDDYGELILEMLIANGIPEDQFTVKLLSDGSGSYNIFNSTFNTTEATAKYNEMVLAWSDLKTLASEAESYSTDLFADLPYRGGVNYSILKNYTYVMANEEENIEWWLPRISDTLKSPDTVFINSVKASPSIKLKNVYTMLQSIVSKGFEDEFKQLYSFNNEMFEEAVNQNKDVMLILGTRTNLEYHFEDYINFIRSYYGDSFVYYYKGHPGTPTGMDEVKKSLLDSLDLIDVESSIAAELILFFYPDIHLSGYPSTTFQSAQDAGKAHALLNISEASANSSTTYSSIMDMFVSYQSDGTFLIEYSNSTEPDVWDPVTLTFI